MVPLKWDPVTTPAELQKILTILGEEYPISTEGNGALLQFQKVEERRSSAQKTADGILISYGIASDAIRAVGAALAGLETNEDTTFRLLGIMLDCSRNGVMKVEHIKRWFRRMALMGYNMAMFYTEDTYKLPDVEYFGYMRGGYSAEEIRAIDDYADSLGIEVIACIQTLGHMGQMLKWGEPFRSVRDTGEVMLVDAPETAALIEKMLQFWSENLRSRRIHVGMDETHDLGRGRFMDLNGYESGFSMFNRHLAMVNELCAKYNLDPMIWSDMYFRMSNKDQNYYDLVNDIPADVVAKIPEGVDLVYWDYFNTDEQFYCDFIRKHQKLNRKVVMGSGVWIWSRLAHDFPQTIKTVWPCLNACRECGVDELFFTLWGDDGAYCEVDTALAGLCWSADVAYGLKEDDPATAARFEAVCGASYYPQRIAHEVEPQTKEERLAGYRLLWDDPLLGIGWNGYVARNPEFDREAVKNLTEFKAKLAPYANEKAAGRVSHQIALAEAIITHLVCRRAILDAYKSGDKAALAQVASDTIPPAVAAYEAVGESFREWWLDVYKPFGLETIQRRNATITFRFGELARRIEEYCAGKVENIAELEEIVPADASAIAYAYSVKGVMSGSQW